MDPAIIRRKLFEYIWVPDDQKARAIYILAEDKIEENNYIWNDEFVEEMTLRKNEDMWGKPMGVLEELGVLKYKWPYFEFNIK